MFTYPDGLHRRVHLEICHVEPLLERNLGRFEEVDARYALLHYSIHASAWVLLFEHLVEIAPLCSDYLLIKYRH